MWLPLQRRCRIVAQWPVCGVLVRWLSCFALFDEHGPEWEMTPMAIAPFWLLFAGGESHYPNQEGFEWFLTEHTSLVKKKQQPECSIAITGNRRQGLKETSHYSLPTFSLPGFFPSLDEAYRNEYSCSARSYPDRTARVEVITTIMALVYRWRVRPLVYPVSRVRTEIRCDDCRRVMSWSGPSLKDQKPVPALPGTCWILKRLLVSFSNQYVLPNRCFTFLYNYPCPQHAWLILSL